MKRREQPFDARVCDAVPDHLAFLSERDDALVAHLRQMLGHCRLAMPTASTREPTVASPYSTSLQRIMRRRSLASALRIPATSVAFFWKSTKSLRSAAMVDFLLVITKLGRGYMNGKREHDGLTDW